MPPADLPDLVNPVKQRMQAGDVALGMIVRLARSGDVVRIAKSTGHDFIFIDAQHSLFSLETIGHMAQVGLGCGTAVLVRARSCDDPDISLMLDNGVTGIIFPDIDTAAEAKRAVKARFPQFAPSDARGNVRAVLCPEVGGRPAPDECSRTTVPPPGPPPAPLSSPAMSAIACPAR